MFTSGAAPCPKQPRTFTSYGKAEVRPGRKMGHINYLYPLSEDGHHG